MAIITTVPGASAAVWRDEFTLFFNITENADCSGGTTGPPECQSATLASQPRDPTPVNVSASAGNEELFTINA
jgi:hypothetical protein